jgi:hypothetical protein
MLKQNSSRIINYQELERACQVFNTNLEIEKKRRFLGKNQPQKLRKKRKIKQSYYSFSKEKQTLLDDFFGRFLHSEVLHTRNGNVCIDYNTCCKR